MVRVSDKAVDAHDENVISDVVLGAILTEYLGHMVTRFWHICG
jgi:hypothetical protein